MAAGKKKPKVVVRLVSTLGTGAFYVTRKSSKKPKLELKKYDPVARKRALFVEHKK